MSQESTFGAAIRRGDVLSLRRLIEERDADVNMTMEITQEELYQRYPPSKRDELTYHSRNENNVKMPALHLASIIGNANVVELLLEKKANVNARSRESCWKTALFRALEYDCLEVVNALLRGGADVNQEAHFRLTPLAFCCRFHRPQFIPMLLRHGAYIQGSKWSFDTPLHSACSKDDLQSASILVQHGADVNARDCCHRTPIFRAGPATMRMLIANGAQVNIHDDEYGFTSLHIVSEQGDSIQAAEILLSNNADIEALTFQEQTPLHLAVSASYRTVIGESPDMFEVVPLLLTHQRSRHGTDGVSSLLLKKTDNLDNALHLAGGGGVAHLLVEHCRGPDGTLLSACHQMMFARNVLGHTPLSKARQRPKARGRPELVQYLQSFTSLALAVSAENDPDGDETVAVRLNPSLDNVQQAIATDCLCLIRNCSSVEGSPQVPDAALYMMLGYLSTADVMKRWGIRLLSESSPRFR